MAQLPPRKNLTPTKISKENLTPLQILLKLGFPKNRAAKALAATGHRGVQLASDWLLTHIQDPTLDSDETREYVLHICPIGILAERLATFWKVSKELAWNGAHNLTPHITLVSFFKAPDELAEQIANVFETSIHLGECSETINLDTYISPNFMGLSVADKHAKWLKSLATRFVNKLADLGITAVPREKSLHVSLAYQFPSDLYQPLRSLVEKLDTYSPAKWEFRLYSRDSRLHDAHVYKVIHTHVPREHDELELRSGDYIYLSEGACNASVDGWVEGTSWLTGTSGHLPLNHIKRTAESDAWTLHYASQAIVNKMGESIWKNDEKNTKPTDLSPTIDTSGDVPMDSELVVESQLSSAPSRQIFICRHGERVDFTFGAWIPYCFESNGTYIRRDVNMPKEVPPRNIQEYQSDTILTTLGEIQANLIGDAMKTADIKIDAAYTSPSLRCVQTLSYILKGLDSNVPIRVEPCLVEWLAWYPHGLPVWMTPEDLSKAGFNVDINYDPFIKISELPLKENAVQYYQRSHDFTTKVIRNTVGNVLLVGHASTLPACTRQLIGGQIPPASDLIRLAQKVPFLGSIAVDEGPDGWQVNSPPFPPITHMSNSRFDWKTVI